MQISSSTIVATSPEPLSEKLKNSFPYNIEALLPNEADALCFMSCAPPTATGAAGFENNVMYERRRASGAGAEQTLSFPP